MALRENMKYDEKNDEYTCQNEKKLKSVYVGTRKSKSGFESEITYYECENCECCQYKKNFHLSYSEKAVYRLRQGGEVYRRYGGYRYRLGAERTKAA